MEYQLFVRWNMEPDSGGSCLTPKEGYHTVELVRPNGDIVASRTFCNNNDRVYGYCLGMVEAFKLLRVAIDPHGERKDFFDLEMPRCLEGRGGRARHLTADTSRQD